MYLEGYGKVSGGPLDRKEIHKDKNFLASILNVDCSLVYCIEKSKLVQLHCKHSGTES